MLRLSDRITVAFGNQLGIQLSVAETKLMAELLVRYQQNRPLETMAVLKRLFQE